MEVILREDVDKLGSRGQVVKVADGYARNFLLPKRLAVLATAANKKIVEQERLAHLRREATERSAAEELAKLDPQPDEETELAEMRAAMMRAEKTIAEISELTGWNASLIKVRAFRARRKLQKLFADLKRKERS